MLTNVKKKKKKGQQQTALVLETSHPVSVSCNWTMEIAQLHIPMTHKIENIL